VKRALSPPNKAIPLYDFASRNEFWQKSRAAGKSHFRPAPELILPAGGAMQSRMADGSHSMAFPSLPVAMRGQPAITCPINSTNTDETAFLLYPHGFYAWA
jgi:hypothetical protein